MVHEGIAWFHDANPRSPVLTMTLSVAHPFTVTGHLADVYGRPLSGGELLASGGHAARATASGAYTMVVPLTGTYALTASAPGYASLPPAYAIEPPVPGEIAYSFVLPPIDYANVVTNGHFERGLEGWALGSLSATLPAPTSTAHTGATAVQLAASDLAAQAWLSQTVALTPLRQGPHLSLMYAPLAVAGGAALEVSVISGTMPVTYTLSLTVAGWTHFAAELPRGLGDRVDLELALTQSVSPAQGSILTPTMVLIDEVQLGRRLSRVYLPLVLE
jgi:hypothetical protein